MADRVFLVLATDALTDRPILIPDSLRRRLVEAGEVHVVAPVLTSSVRRWASDTDAATRAAGRRLRTLISEVKAAGQHQITGLVGDENPLQAIADALALFGTGQLIVATEAPQGRRPARRRRVCEQARDRFGLPVAELEIASRRRDSRGPD